MPGGLVAMLIRIFLVSSDGIQASWRRSSSLICKLAENSSRAVESENAWNVRTSALWMGVAGKLGTLLDTVSEKRLNMYMIVC